MFVAHPALPIKIAGKKKNPERTQQKQYSG
jgi:hypothetical protein